MCVDKSGKAAREADLVNLEINLSLGVFSAVQADVLLSEAV